MLQKIVSILFAIVMLFASCTRHLTNEGQVVLLVIDLVLLALWCLLVYFQFRSEWKLASPVGYTLMLATLIVLFFEIDYTTTTGIIAFFADVAATALMITSLVLSGRKGSSGGTTTTRRVK